MKHRVFIIIALVALALSFTRCDLGDRNYLKYEMLVNLTNWDLPDTVKISTPFNIDVRTQIENSCVKNTEFFLDKYNDTIYRVYASAKYENHGEDCASIIEYKDSSFNVTLSKTGKCYFLFLSEGNFKPDSVIVIP